MIYQLDDGRIVGCGVGEHGSPHGKSEVVRLARCHFGLRAKECRYSEVAS